LSQAEQFSKASYISLETHRKNGEPVRTPVWVVVDGGLLYVRTDPTSGKVKRIRRDQHVRVARANMGGKVSGDWVDGEARLVDEKESSRIMELFLKKYGLQIRLLRFLGRLTRSSHRQSAIVEIQLKEG